MKKWIWMPHPGHFICSSSCRFKLNTYVGKYIVSTVGEYFPDSEVRKIFAASRGIAVVGMGDAWDSDYLKKIGYEEIGCGRKYETMVFRSRKSKHKCCPYETLNGRELDFLGYNTAEDATKGHMKLCEKWSRK